RLIDFTLALRVGAFHMGARKIDGTRSYIAPETIRRKAPVPGTDLYSLACSFYEMITFRPPFVADDPNMILSKHLKEPPTHLKNYTPNVDSTVDEVIVSMLAKRPQDRPTDCATVLQKLARVESLLHD
ncbi:MAG: hypothetical protein QF886_25810, partial [Planctomycetota bacterium]|nr:hypothetical protein [Planctomycetota bacterium]